jgi:hypothetical protein
MAFMNKAAADFFDAAYLAETIASELATAAYHLGRKGNTIVARALLEEARRHTVQAVRLRAQVRSTAKRSHVKIDRARLSPGHE